MRLTPATRNGLWIALATGVYGVSFGALAVTSGLSLLQTQALSAVMFTGGSQFAFIGSIAIAYGLFSHRNGLMTNAAICIAFFVGGLMLLFPQNVVSLIGLVLVAVAWFVERKILFGTTSVHA